MPRWSLADIPWDQFRPELVDHRLLAVIKAAGLVEHNSASYGRYLQRVFADDPAVCADAERWAGEEIQHGEALGRWAGLADPSYDPDQALRHFAAFIQLPEDAEESVRGNRRSEMIARCTVEVGTSSFYSSFADKVREPVLRAIARRIAADEFAHFSLFAGHARRYAEQEPMPLHRRLGVAVGRMVESGDDELAYALYCAMGRPGAYRREPYTAAYHAWGTRYYESRHTDRAMQMVAKAVGIPGDGLLVQGAKKLAWRVIRRNRSRYTRVVAESGLPALTGVAA